MSDADETTDEVVDDELLGEESEDDVLGDPGEELEEELFAGDVVADDDGSLFEDDEDVLDDSESSADEDEEEVAVPLDVSEDGDDEPGGEPAVDLAAIEGLEVDDPAELTADDEVDDVDADDSIREGEFVCSSCHMAKRASALADPDEMLCRDCV